MSRNASSTGGWCKLWGKKSLESESLIRLGDEVEVTWYRILCAANCVSWHTGRFEWVKERIPLSLEQISLKARSKPENVLKLVQEGMILQGRDKVYFVPNWADYQHPKANADQNAEFNSELKLPKMVQKKGKICNTRKTTSTPSEADASGHHIFIDWFHDSFQQRTGQKPKINGRDGKALAELLKLYQVETLQKLCAEAWDHKNDFIKGKAQTIHGFADVINQLISTSKAIPDSKPDKYAHLTEQIIQ